MEKSWELLSKTLGERQAGLVYVLWRGSLKQRDPKSEPYDHSRQQQHELVVNRPKQNGERITDPHNAEPIQIPLCACCILHLNITNLKRVIFLHVERSPRTTLRDERWQVEAAQKANTDLGSSPGVKSKSCVTHTASGCLNIIYLQYTTWVKQ